MAAIPELLLDPRLQPAAYRPIFARFGRLHVPNLLRPDHAQTLRLLLSKEVRNEPALAAAMKLVNSDGFLRFVKTLTGDERPVCADAMITRHRPGRVLTAHEDEAEDGAPLYAYALNLTPDWRADCGGLLLFLDDRDHVEEGYVPAFNALDIFRVPQRHAVSVVTPFAPGPRLSVTGWIRSRVPD